MAYLFLIFFYFRTDGQTDGRSDYIMPQILFGGIKRDVDGKALSQGIHEWNMSALQVMVQNDKHFKVFFISKVYKWA